MRFKILMLMMCGAISLSAQVTGMGEKNPMLQSEMENSKSMDSKFLESDQLPVTNVIDPKLYYPGPGDVLVIKALPMIITPTPVVVSPDNKILLPRSGGLIDVDGKTLEEVRLLIEENFTKYKDDAIVNVSFQKPHLSVVSVEGKVLNSSIFNLPSTFKVSDAINFANKRTSITEKNNASEDTYIQERLRVQKNFPAGGEFGEVVEFWQRNILVIHEDGTSQNVDLIKSKTKNNAYLNPYIRQGDQIKVPFDKQHYPTISVKGEVTRPITMPYKKGDKLSELAQYGLGLTDFADVDNIYYFDGNEKIKLSASDNQIVVNNDREISPGSMIIVGSNSQKSVDSQGVVTIRGYVANPGAYPIVNYKTTLSEIIETAGGLTEGAYLPSAKVYRATNEFDELSLSRTEAFKLFRKSNLSLEDTVRYTLDVSSIEPIVSVDFTKALSDSKYDIDLVNGDEIIIPTRPNRVYVFGRVQNPGFIEFESGKDVAYYIRNAGGYTDVADAGRTAVIHKSSSKWINDEEAEVYDGDYIYVPGEVDLSTSTEQAKVSTYAAIASIILSLGFLIVNIVRE